MYEQNPFGNPDGARADLREIESAFITDFPYGISINKYPSEILNKRVIVGAKGSGKTVYLRKIQSMLKQREEDNASIFVDGDLEQNLNCTDRVIAFCDLYSQQTLSEKWTKLWEISILTTIAYKFLCNTRLSNYINNNDFLEIKDILTSFPFLSKVDKEFKCEYSIYSFFQILLSESISKDRMDKTLNNPGYLQLKRKLQSVLRNAPELYFFLDSIDLEYEHAPLHWAMCQKGLFYAVYIFLQDSIWGEKLHLIITLRDNVFTSILRSEHSTKFSNESHIFLLSWDTHNIKYFLEQKIKSLKDCFFISNDYETQGKTVNSWLGLSTIMNEYGQEEKIDNFIIRHTRQVPRDVIIICNELATIRSELEHNHDLNIVERITDIVLANSKGIGAELITICAKNLTANHLPAKAGVYRYSDGFTASQYYHESTYQKLLNLLQAKIKQNSFGYEVIAELENEANLEFDNKSFLPDILWQNGVLGYLDKNKSVFYAQSFKGDTLLPKGKEKYIIRSCIEQKIEII